MPVFSCGGMRYQHTWENITIKDVPQENQKNLEKIIQFALIKGINHIETARDYGTSEIQLGQILPSIKRDSIIIQTKVVPTQDPKDFLNKFQQSMKNLNLDYVDLLGIHGINNSELLNHALKKDGCLDIAEKLRQDGLVRHIGFSTHGSTETIIKAISSDRFEYVNIHWYYIFQNNWPAIELARQKDMGVFIISPSDKGGMLYQPSSKLVNLCQPLSPIVFNDLFCLSHFQVHTLSIGAAKPEDFDEHLKTLDLLENAEKHLTPIINRLEEEAIHILGKDWFYGWHKGLPPHEETPQNINIPIILWLRNLTLAYDMKEYAKMRYNLLGDGGHWFAGNHAREFNKSDILKCLKNSPFADKIPQYLKEAEQLLGAEAVKRLSQQDN